MTKLNELKISKERSIQTHLCPIPLFSTDSPSTDNPHSSASQPVPPHAYFPLLQGHADPVLPPSKLLGKHILPQNPTLNKALAVWSHEYILRSTVQGVSRWFFSFVIAIKDTRAYKSNNQVTEKRDFQDCRKDCSLNKKTPLTKIPPLEMLLIEYLPFKLLLIQVSASKVTTQKPTNSSLEASCT